MMIARLLVLTAFLTSVRATTSVVDLGYSQYRGHLNTDTQVTNFLGIRFAAPPTGNLRFRAPQAPGTVSGIIDATMQPPQCYQAFFGFNPLNPFREGDFNPDLQSGVTPVPPNPIPEDEDCLFLNVHVPGEVDPSKSLPVVVWIHGGGYLSGSASVWDGKDLVHESGNAVINVIIQYRLGLFGFLAGNAVKQDGAPNAGLLDQEFALQWVQQHIHKFGGDPSRVTIWGVSSGGGSVLQLAAARDGTIGTQLFKNVIASSAFVPSQYAYNDPLVETLFTEAANQSNCPSSPPSVALGCLRGAPASALKQTNLVINNAGFYGTFLFVPVVDGTFIVRPTAESFALSNINGQRLLTIFNLHEGRIFVNGTAAEEQTTDEYARLLLPKLNTAEAQNVISHYNSIPGTNLDKFDAIYGDIIFKCPTLHLLRGFDGAAHKGTFAVPPGDHGYDVPYYFPNSSPFPPTSNSASFAASFAQSFLSFIRFDDPNQKFTPTFNGAPNVTPNWLAWADQDGSRVDMIFGVTSDDQPAIQSGFTNPDLLDRCAYWASVHDVTGH